MLGQGDSTVRYWVTSLTLIVFGVLAMFSIGRPFLMVGVAMVILGPFRQRPAWFWPPLAAVIAYNVGYWAVARLSWTATRLLAGPRRRLVPA
jgi:hypothetical protein